MMKDTKIREQIITAVRKSAESNELVGEFILEMLYEESLHAGQWWFREPYKKKMESYIKKMPD